LLEEGHCLRDQALQFCSTARSSIAAGKPDLGAASLSTIMQLIANGFGATLLPEMALNAEIGANPEVRALRFADPEPRREIGLAWRRTSARKADFAALGEVFKDCRTPPAQRQPSCQNTALIEKISCHRNLRPVVTIHRR
jgi:LysR family transcriptional regulator, hydrogen peroxide-inducible genes activator